jgi:hypothetical protein
MVRKPARACTRYAVPVSIAGRDGVVVVTAGILRQHRLHGHPDLACNNPIEIGAQRAGNFRRHGYATAQNADHEHVLLAA